MTQRPTNEKQRRRAHRQRRRAEHQAFEANKPAPRFDSAAAMVKGTLLEGRLDDPAHNPLWLTPEEAEERQAVMSEVAASEESDFNFGVGYYHVHLRGRVYGAENFREMQSRCCYQMLREGASIEQAAKACYWEPSRVEQFAHDFGFDRTKI